MCTEHQILCSNSTCCSKYQSRAAGCHGNGTPVQYSERRRLCQSLGFLSFLPLPCFLLMPSTSSLHFFFVLFILRHMCKGNATISFWNERARGPSPSDKQQVVTEDVLLFPMLSSPQTIKGRFNAWIQHGTNLNDVRLHFSFFFYGLFSSGVICLQLTPPSARSSLTPTNFKSSFTASIILLFGLPIGPSGSCYLNLNLSILV